MKEYNELLWLGVPKKKRDSVRGQRSTRYLDPSHVVFMELRIPPWDLESTEVMQYESYVGEDERLFKVPQLQTDYAQSVHVPVEYLKKIVDNINAQGVLITVVDNYPLSLVWRDGEDDWFVAIAPRIENE